MAKFSNEYNLICGKTFTFFGFCLKTTDNRDNFAPCKSKKSIRATSFSPTTSTNVAVLSMPTTACTSCAWAGPHGLPWATPYLMSLAVMPSSSHRASPSPVSTAPRISALRHCSFRGGSSMPTRRRAATTLLVPFPPHRTL